MPSPTWTFTSNSLPTPSAGFGYSLLQNGKVLIAGGDTNPQPTATASAVLYDPTTDLFTSTGSLNTARRDTMSVTLQNGKVLIVSGADITNTPLTSCELYDPVSGTWSFTGSLSVPRQGIIPLLLSNGKVLASGGRNGNSILSTAEIYDPVAGTWSMTTGAPVSSRSGYSAVALQNGKALIACGEFPMNTSLISCELFDPTTETFSTTGSTSVPHVNTEVGDNACCLLNDGTALWAGGTSSSGDTDARTSEIYNPSTGLWGNTSLMSFTHVGMMPIVLGNGKVLLAAGGPNNTTFPPQTVVELYDPVAVSWSTTTPTNVAIVYAALVKLSPNIVLMAGGIDTTHGYNPSAELFNYSPNQGANMSFHNAETGSSIHVSHAFTYANAAARTSASVVSADIGKIAKQTDTNRYYVLIDTTPTWTEITAGPAGSNATTVHADANPNLTGDVQLVSGTNVTLAQVGQAITINSTGGGGGSSNVVWAADTTEVDITAASTPTATTLTATITPSNSSKHVLVSANLVAELNVTGTNNLVDVILKRGATTVRTVFRAVGISGTSNIFVSIPIEYLDAPASSSPVTYTIWVNLEGGWVGRFSTNTGNNTDSSITLTEV